MSKSNWKGTSGWSAINDPTGSLEGRVLQATAGVSALAEDYLLQIVGSSVSFADVNYGVRADYAFYSESDATNISFGLQTRAGTFSGSPELAQNSYLGLLDFGTGTVKIIQRYGGKETILGSAGLSTAFSYGISVKHTLDFTCTGTTTVDLALALDGETLLTVGDTTQQKLSSGYPGLYVGSGTVYIDNFEVFKYTSDGAAPADWLPSNANNLVLWLKGDTGITATGTSISGWADQSGNGNDAATALGIASPLVVSDDVNNYDVVQFDGRYSYTEIPDDATLDCFANGMSMFVVMNVAALTTSQFIGTKGNASYSLGVINALPGTTNGGIFNNGADTYSSADVISQSNYQIIGVVGGTLALEANYYFWMDGTNSGASALVAADNSDPLTLGKYGTSATGLLNGKIAEVVMYQDIVSDGDRQKIEGYLAQKYGIWNRLPADHPYRYITPTV